MSDDDPYVYPGTRVLKNLFDIKDAALLDKVERRFAQIRIEQGAPGGNFDLTHLQAIHHHLFQDVYPWAGETRTVEIAKGGNHFLFTGKIEMGMADVHRQVVIKSFLRGLKPGEFASAAAIIIGDLNYVHPFREGNGRTQLEYLRQLGEQAGHELDLARLRPKEWIEASKAAHEGDYGAMRREIERTIDVKKGRGRK